MPLVFVLCSVSKLHFLSFLILHSGYILEPKISQLISSKHKGQDWIGGIGPCWLLPFPRFYEFEQGNVKTADRIRRTFLRGEGMHQLLTGAFQKLSLVTDVAKCEVSHKSTRMRKRLGMTLEQNGACPSRGHQTHILHSPSPSSCPLPGPLSGWKKWCESQWSLTYIFSKTGYQQTMQCDSLLGKLAGINRRTYSMLE